MMSNPSADQGVSCQRISQRLKNQDSATMRRGLEEFPVTVLDIGVLGFGLLSMVHVDIGTQVELEISGFSGIDVYQCRVMFCRQDGSHYHLGLEIMEQEPELLYMDVNDKKG
ncbi:MAG: PilZ domain-containing protein [Magnetococcales bacterium]|nr:PilZ domain-containing protein [Magnetococcales bacterium]